SKDSPYYSWYRFEEHPYKYDCWWGIDTLPNVNELDPAYQRFIIHDQDSVLEYWMKQGAKGWRLDVVDELPGQFVKPFQQKMKEIDPNSMLIGEVWEDASNKVSYGEMREYLLGEELDSTMNYPFRDITLDFFTGKKNAGEVHRALMSLYENYPKEHFYVTMNLIGSHDVPRALTLLGEAPPAETLSREEQARYFLTEDQIRLAIARLKLLTLFQMTFPGAPCVYYGDEAGVEGYGDPYCRATYPWGSEIKELLNWYKKTIAWRHQYAVLKTGQWISLCLQEDVYGYVRVIENERDVFNQIKENNVAVVLLNRNRHRGMTVEIDLSKWCQGEMIDLIQAGKAVQLDNGLLEIALGPLEGKLLIQSQV
ncbi:alpha-amylase family glycosyl hydrolase, partial [Peptococcaceae bacterium]|nr:alpha-amylase family glycosyl hydrolase [Peptococcaceae bacterium]